MTTITTSILALVAALALAACTQGSSQPSAVGAPVGQERGDCRPGGGCDPGLDCRSNLCVRPPPADCAKVAEQLSFLMLDNYTPREQRDGFLAETRRQCETMHLSKDDGECLLRARTRGELGACPRPLGVGDCAKIKQHLEQVRGGSGVDAYLVTEADRIIGRCKAEAPTLIFEQCVMAAKTLDDVGRCSW
jgi:hypothetical protein